jgi:hypothetical protein
LRHKADSWWIMAARLLCHLQCSVTYLSRLQRTLVVTHSEGCFEAAHHGSSTGHALPMHKPMGCKDPNVGQGRRRAKAPLSNLDSDLEAFSQNLAHGSFTPLAFQPSVMTNCVNQQFLSYYFELLLRHSHQ